MWQRRYAVGRDTTKKKRKTLKLKLKGRAKVCFFLHLEIVELNFSSQTHAIRLVPEPSTVLPESKLKRPFDRYKNREKKSSCQKNTKTVQKRE